MINYNDIDFKINEFEDSEFANHIEIYAELRIQAYKVINPIDYISEDHIALDLLEYNKNMLVKRIEYFLYGNIKKHLHKLKYEVLYNITNSSDATKIASAFDNIIRETEIK